MSLSTITIEIEIEIENFTSVFMRFFRVIFSLVISYIFRIIRRFSQM